VNWSEYENEVFELCRLHFPHATVSRNVKLLGRYSKQLRQIDVLIEEDADGVKVKWIIDCKLYNRKIDVKPVESFISMVEDIGADKGILITEIGYSETALNRAHFNPQHIELDIYSLKELKSVFHGTMAIPYAGENAAIIVAPLGWIIDAQRRDGSICMLYQRGLILEDVGLSKEVAYVNFWNRRISKESLSDLITMQEKYMRENLSVKSITYQESVKRTDARTLIRKADVEGYPGLELTGFIEFENFIFFCVWFSPENTLERNTRKLEYLMKSAIPAQMTLLDGVV
jgi:hypothetical protein